MPAIPGGEDELKIAAEFTRMYNKWFTELVSIEDNLLAKAEHIQELQNALDEESNKLKRLNENLVQAQIEQNYAEDVLTILAKEQEELQREILKMEESFAEPTDADTVDCEETSALLETLVVRMNNIRDKVKNLVEKINKDKSIDKESPFPIYRTILDHYADALLLLDSNMNEIQQRFNTLQEICLQYSIPSDIFSRP